MTWQKSKFVFNKHFPDGNVMFEPLEERNIKPIKKLQVNLGSSPSAELRALNWPFLKSQN